MYLQKLVTSLSFCTKMYIVKENKIRQKVVKLLTDAECKFSLSEWWTI